MVTPFFFFFEEAFAAFAFAMELRTDARHELRDLLDELRLVMPIELDPGRERARVCTVDKDLAVQMIDLVLIRARLQAVHDLVDRIAMTVPRLTTHMNIAL